MKKVLLLLIVAVATFALVGCKSSDYKVDGEFLAYEVEASHNAPQVSMVTVTIKDGEVDSFYIDVRQGDATQTAGVDTTEDTSDDTWAYTWKEQTKKELGDAYGMVAYGGATLEWYEQAELLEAHFLANGVDETEVDAEGNTDAVTGVSITVDTIYALAAEALENAKAGKFQAVACTSDDLTFASMTVDEDGNVSDLFLDVLQGDPDGATFAFKTQTKQELGDDYGMVAYGGATLEWFEQANLLTDYVEANGWSNGDAPTVTGVTVTTDTYFEVFDSLFGYVA